MAKTIKLTISDPVTDALIKSQNKRLAVLERAVKKKKKGKEVSISGELRDLNSLKSQMARQQLRTGQQVNSLLSALKKDKSKPFMAQVIPSPS